VLLPDGPGVHVAYVGCERAGAIVCGIGPRAGEREIEHLLGKTGATVLVTRAVHRGSDMAERVARLREAGLPLRHHLVVERELDPPSAMWLDGAPLEPGPLAAGELERRRLASDAPFLLNSTSGTTGLPKCVTHTERRWKYFHSLAVEAGELDARDRFMSVLPAPFGFGLWTAHVTPTLLGAPTVLMAEFSAERLVEEIEHHRVSVLAAVSTQFILMLESGALERCDASSLRVLFTGGEAVPYERAAEFEQRTGACVLQFYGSNETGALSRTTTKDTRERRLRTAGRVIPEMNVRLFDEQGGDTTASGRGQAACRGPATSDGYWADPEANTKLYSDDGWMRIGDVVELDAEGYLRVVGRTADFIIRGGKNISAAVVEEEVGSHPAVALAAAVPVPDPIFGERVCVCVELRAGQSLTLEQLNAHLAERGTGKELHPERLLVLPALPRASGGKVAKGELRELVLRRLEQTGP
jgi:acyl-CoA synthetase